MQRRLAEEAEATRKGQRDDIRKRQVGSGMRADKIRTFRTYRFGDDTVKDHLSGHAAPLHRVMAGGINILWNYEKMSYTFSGKVPLRQDR